MRRSATKIWTWKPASHAPTEFTAEVRVSSETDAEMSPLSADDGQSWDGDGSASMAPDDGEWGGEAKAHGNNLDGDDDADVTELARSQESLQSHLHRQALALHLSEEDAAALRFLIESLNEDGYLEEPLSELVEGLAGEDPEEREQMLHHFTVALSLLKTLEPVGVGAQNLAECLTLQLNALLSRDDIDLPRARLVAVALRICAQPMDILARRDIKRLVQLCGAPDAAIREAIALIGRLEPKPGRRFVDVERNIVVPDVIVTAGGQRIAGAVQGPSQCRRDAPPAGA